MKHVFSQPDRVMVGTRGEVGNRLFLFQVRQGPRFKVVKCEKQQLSALAEWLGVAVKEFTRPGHLPDDFSLEPEYEPDFAIGDIAVDLDEENETIEVTFSAFDDDDDESLEITLTKEWAGGLAIAIVRAVEAGRPPCPLCAGPLDPRGHDCPRTNGYRPPIR